jgi:hypothetical protein
LNLRRKYIYYFLAAGSVVAIATWTYYPEKSPKIYKAIVKRVKLGREELRQKPCFETVNYALQMNDKAIHYIGESFLNGPGGYMKSGKDIVKNVWKGKLVKVEANEYFVLDTMYYSYPFLTPDARNFIDELGFRFHRKLENTHLRNRNAITRSSHLHGTSFDISYKQFFGDRIYTPMELSYLHDILAETLYEMRESRKCWVTYEVWQTCFHVVVR